MRILYDSKNTNFKRPFGPLKEGQECEINIHIPVSCKTKTVSLQLFEENGGEKAAFSLCKQSEYEYYEIYSCRFCLNEAGLYFYRFFIQTENEQFPLFKQGYGDTNMCEGELWQLSCIPKDYSVPYEFKGKIMYQIFPDRFFKWGECDTTGKLEPFSVHSDFNDTPAFLPDQNGIVQNNDFFGGNLKGIAKKMPYLARLGVSVIYLNPIFKAYSNHRYDTADYKKIDELLGSEKDFKNLCKTAHRYNIKVILDGVFSHTGSNSVYFDSEGVFGNGAVSCEDSPYREWFDFKDYPHDYTSWWGIKTLPCVNEMSAGFKNFIIDDEDSVVAHWLRLGADGFRLDVADELPDEFIVALRKRVKEINPKAIVIGEVWEDASNKISYGKRRRYFTNSELDSTMNYPFRNAILDFVLKKDSGEGFVNTVMSICENYPWDTVNVLMNSLSTHDTSRILSLLSGVTPPQSKEERAAFALSNEQLETATDRLFCASALQFVLPGMPCIYYGDEIGTEGFEDPFCRSFFDWSRLKDNKIFEHFKKLCKMRNGSAALKHGGIQINLLKEGLISIERYSIDQKVTAYVNMSDQPFKLFGECKVRLAHNCELEKYRQTINPCGFAIFED